MDTYLEKYQIPAIDYAEGRCVENYGIQAKDYPSERTAEAECVISLSKMKPTLWSELQEQ